MEEKVSDWDSPEDFKKEQLPKDIKPKVEENSQEITPKELFRPKKQETIEVN